MSARCWASARRPSSRPGSSVAAWSTTRGGCARSTCRARCGRCLDDASRAVLVRSPMDLLLVIADGLSATAVNRHAVPLVAALRPLLPAEWRLGPAAVVEQGRVAIGDDVGAALGAPLVAVLI